MINFKPTLTEMRTSAILLFICISGLLNSCKKEVNKKTSVSEKGIKQQIDYATGFEIVDYGSYKILSVTKAWPDSEVVFNYALLKDEAVLPNGIEVDATIQIPVKNIVVTSTTHLPALELLGVTQTLKGFPNLDYISSKTVRKRITAGQIKDLGQNESINTESTISLQPDVVISFGVAGENKALNSIQRAGIPVFYNGDWVEKTPLGQAEWIKFFAALYDKEAVADSIFKEIETNYLTLKNKAQNATSNPTVLSGAMFKDVWYLPKGESWAAQLIADANADYLYKDTQGTGSASLSIEEVLITAQNADFWIAPNSFENYDELGNTSAAYQQFKAFKERKIYGFASAKGETGGLIYYELASSRPDWVLEDLVAIFHPELELDHKPHFFKALD